MRFRNIMFVRFHTINYFFALSSVKNVRFALSSTQLANRNDIHHHPAMLWRFCDSGAAYETPDLLTYLFIYLSWVGWVGSVS